MLFRSLDEGLRVCVWPCVGVCGHVCIFGSSCTPADTELPVEACAVGCCFRFEVAGVEVCQCVVCKAMHGPCVAIQILIYHPRNKL